MRVHIFAQGMELPDELKAYLERRLLFAVGRFAPKIERVEAGLIDVNAERGGGVDKRCRLVAKLPNLGRLVVQADDAEWLPLINRTTDRFGRSVQRKIELSSIRGG